MKKRRAPPKEKPQTPREIQAAELRRRRANWKNPDPDAAPAGNNGATTFVKATIPASPRHFCWFCFENDRELFVAGTTGVHFCRQCAAALGRLAAEAPTTTRPPSTEAPCGATPTL